MSNYNYVDYYEKNIEQLCIDLERNKSSAWESFVRMIYSKSSFLLKDIKVAEKEEAFKDLVSKAVLEFCQDKAKLMENRSSCGGLLGSVVTRVKNRFVDSLRKLENKYTQPYSDYETYTSPPSGDTDLADEINILLQKNFNKEHITAWNMSFTGYSNKEIALVLNVSESRAGNLIYKVRSFLRLNIKY